MLVVFGTQGLLDSLVLQRDAVLVFLLQHVDALFEVVDRQFQRLHELFQPPGLLLMALVELFQLVVGVVAELLTREQRLAAFDLRAHTQPHSHTQRHTRIRKRSHGEYTYDRDRRVQYLHCIANGDVGVVTDLLQLRLEGDFLRVETVGAFVQDAADVLQQFLVLLFEDGRFPGQTFVMGGTAKAGVEGGEMGIDDLRRSASTQLVSTPLEATDNTQSSDSSTLASISISSAMYFLTLAKPSLQRETRSTWARTHDLNSNSSTELVVATDGADAIVTINCDENQ